MYVSSLVWNSDLDLLVNWLMDISERRSWYKYRYLEKLMSTIILTSQIYVILQSPDDIFALATVFVIIL